MWLWCTYGSEAGRMRLHYLLVLARLFVVIVVGDDFESLQLLELAQLPLVESRRHPRRVWLQKDGQEALGLGPDDEMTCSERQSCRAYRVTSGAISGGYRGIIK